MNKIYSVIGIALIVSAILFISVFTMVVSVTDGESVKRDLFGLVIPEPPLWTSYIPFIGFFIGILFELFSLHGLVGTCIFLTLAAIGGLLLKQVRRTE